MRILLRSALTVGVLAAALAVSSVAAATTTVECGVFSDYVAPDPIAATAGSITFGVNGTPEPIAANATLVPPADTALPSLQGGSPTCLTVTRDAGVITYLAFAPSGTVSGTVILVPDLFGPGQDAYVIAGRFFAPVDVITANPGLSALIKTAADSGSIFTVTFQIDLSTGVPTGFAATTTLSGPVTLVPGGDIQIGAATLPNAVIDATARAALERASALGVPATVVVDGAGTLGPGGSVVVDITLTVTFTAPSVATPTPSPAELPNTSFEAGAASASSPGADAAFSWSLQP